MATVRLTDIVTEDDRAAVLAVERGPGQDAFVSSVAESFQDAIDDARANPRMWAIRADDRPDHPVVGFVMISDGIPEERLAADPDLIGPYFLWRLLIDRREQRRSYGRATLDAVVAYVRDRPGATVLWTSCGQGPGSPRPFYEAYGFRPTGRMLDHEDILRLDLATEDR
jgi:diamine N-acetyltransferase